VNSLPTPILETAAPEGAGGRTPVRRDTAADILGRAAAVAAEIGQRAAERDLTGELPIAEFQFIRDARIGTLRIPARLGGPGGSVGDVIEAIAILASGDSNLAHALRPHFNFVESLVLEPDSAGQARQVRQVLDGVFFGGASTELGTPRPGGVTATLTRRGTGYRLDGQKYYATGTSYADFFYTNAVNEAGESVRLLLPTKRAGIQVLDDFDGMGQRLSGSGGLRFVDAAVEESEIVAGGKGPASGPIGRHASTLRQLILIACQVGSVRCLEAEGIEYAKTIARPIAHSHADRARDDYFVQREVGKIAAARQAADVLLKSAAAVLDKSAAAIIAGDPDAEHIVTRATFSVARSQVVIGPLALQAAETIFNLGGGSAVSRKRNFDRHWRNIRTIMSHNPLSYKEKAIGDHLLNGALTPSGGAF
jgi:alkylation response protein AidB-like acyl-CoA dehydrogenase